MLTLLATLVALGLCGGFLSGLLGLGGAIFMIPLLLYVPPLLGLEALDMKTVAAISMVQVLAASISGTIAHWQNRFVSRRLVIYMGTGIVAGSLSGSILSKHVSSGFLLAVFASMAIVAAVMMFIPRKEQGEGVPADQVDFNSTAAALVGLGVGVFGGMVGAPGAFILIPIMIYLLGIPTRVTIGSTLGIVFLGALFGTIGKLATGQIVWPMALALVVGTIPGAQIGGRVSKRVKTKRLRLLIAVIIAVTGIRMWVQVLTGR
jgi:uncharacterized membrane protein YfcA